MILKNDKNISSVYFGEKVISKIYKGTLLVYEAFSKILANGVPPLTLSNSIGQDLLDYKIYGNSVQDGEPTPTTPIEIESVGERTNNTFNFPMLNKQINTTVDYEKQTIFLDKANNLYVAGQSYTGVGKAFNEFNKVLNITEPDYYCFKAKVICDREDITPRASWNINVSGEGAITPTLVEFKYQDKILFAKFNFTQEIIDSLKNNADTFRMYIYTFREINSTTNVDATVTDLMFIKGDYTIDTIPNYEPYGYKIPVKASGKNLLPNEWKDYSNWKLYGENNTSPYVSYLVKVKPNTTYTISKRNNYIPTTQDNTMNLIINAKKYTESGASSVNKWLVLPNNIANNNPKSINLTTDDDGVLLLSTYNGSNEKIENLIKVCGEIQIEEGSVETEYEPYIEPITTNIYLDEPLRKIDEYQDYIDLKNQKVVRNIKEKKLLSSDNWKTYDYNNYGIVPFIISLDTIGLKRYGHSICSHLKNEKGAIWAVNKVDIYSDHPNGKDYYFSTTMTTLDEWKEFLNNNDFVLGFILETPTEETIELPNIPTLKGTTILSIDTITQPSNMEVIYKGKQVRKWN